MLVAELEALLAHPTPGFVCVPEGDMQDPRRFVVRIQHLVGPPASLSSFSCLAPYIDLGANDIASFYSRYNGLLLYSPLIARAGPDGLPMTNDGGIRLFPIEDWMGRSEQRLREFAGVPYDAPLPRSVRGYIAIGQVPHSSNYFVWQTSGLLAGRFAYLNHGPRNPLSLLLDETLAEGFAELVALMCVEPAKVLARFGCCTWYSDGETSIRWVPIEYVPDVDQVTRVDVYRRVRKPWAA